MLLLIVFDFILYVVFFLFKQKTAYEMRISDWSSDVCSSDLPEVVRQIAIGDVVVVTKSDLRGADDRKTLEATIATYVPDAQVFDSHEPGFSLASIIPTMTGSNASRPTKQIESAGHAHETTSFVPPLDGDVDWPASTARLPAPPHNRK